VDWVGFELIGVKKESRDVHSFIFDFIKRVIYLWEKIDASQIYK